MQQEANILTLPDGLTNLVVQLEINASAIVCDSGTEKFTFSQGKLQQAHKAANSYVLNFGNYPYHCLRIGNDADKRKLALAWNAHPDIKRLEKGSGSYFLWLTLSSIAAIFLLLLLVYFRILPAFSSYVANSISMETEREIGSQLFDQIKTQYKTDDSLTKYTRGFFHSLHFPDAQKLELIVVESADTNAFAMPGAYMVVFKGILHKTKTSEQLAALLAHEYAHVKKRHSLRNLISASLGGLLISFVSGDLSGTVGAVLLSQAHEFRNLAYSRDLETEADETGMQMMAASGLKPSAMSEMLRQIQPAGETELPSFLSTHPVFSERIPHAVAFAKSLKMTIKNQEAEKAYALLKLKLKG